MSPRRGDPVLSEGSARAGRGTTLSSGSLGRSRTHNLPELMRGDRGRIRVSHEPLVLRGWPEAPVAPSPSRLRLPGCTEFGPLLPPASSCPAEPCPWPAFRDSSGLKTPRPFPSRGIWSWERGGLVTPGN